MLINLRRTFLSQQTILLLVLSSISPILGGSTGKIVDFGSKLPEFVDDHPDKGWLIKFYAPWCYHCQQLEPTFMNVAEKVYHKHDKLVVGRVDCTKYGAICEKYHVQSYPTIMFLKKDSAIVYKGDRSADSLVDFAERLDGPDVKAINDCPHLKSVIDRHGLLVLSTEKDTSNPKYKEFEKVAQLLKFSHWFFHYDRPCKNLIEVDNIYLLKRHLDRAIKLDRVVEDPNLSSEDFSRTLIRQIVQESFPVFGSINSMNFERTMSSNKTLAIAVLDEYKPARKFAKSSNEFFKIFGKLAKRIAQREDRFIFGWCSDVELIESIITSSVLLPNLILIKPDFTYHLHLSHNDAGNNHSDQDLPESLAENSINLLLVAAGEGKLNYKGGNSLFYRILRSIFSSYKRFVAMYRANPLLATVLVGLPTLIVIFVIYTTCCYDSSNLDNREDLGDEDSDRDDRQLLTNHVKQD